MNESQAENRIYREPMNELATQPPQEPSVALMLQGMLTSVQQGQITPQTVDVLKGMMDLYERNEARQSARDFAIALTALQGETMRVAATKAVEPKSDGTCRYRFAPYEEIMKQVQPMLTRHGFSLTFDTKIDDNRIFSICTLTHKSGHSRSNQFAVRLGNKPPGSSEAQGDMSNKSYAKRGALCDALNIVVDHDDDGRAEGSPISVREAQAFRDRVHATGSDEAKFLAFAGAHTFEEISETRFKELDAFLEKREKQLANKRAADEAEKPAAKPFEREPGETGKELF